MSKRAFFVVGPEGTGTHMMRDALVEAGCYWEQDFENVDAELNFSNKPDNIVLRRSLPHAHKWPSLLYIYNQFQIAGYYIAAIGMLRDFYASARSVIRRGYGGSINECFLNQRRAFESMGVLSCQNMSDFTYVTYEAFCLSEGFRRWLFKERLKLPYPKDFQIFFANNQYYGDEK